MNLRLLIPIVAFTLLINCKENSVVGQNLESVLEVSKLNEFKCSLDRSTAAWIDSIQLTRMTYEKSFLNEGSVMDTGKYLLSNNGLYAFGLSRNGSIHVYSKLETRHPSFGSIWFANTNITCCSHKKHSLLFEKGGSLTIKCDTHTLWMVGPLNCNEEKCGKTRLELTDYGNLQIVSSCGKILWETRSDTELTERIGPSSGYLVDNDYYKFLRSGVNSNKTFNVYRDTNWCKPKDEVSKCLVLPECSKINCLFPTIFPPEKFCQYVRNCPGCGPDYLCKGEFVFDVSDGLDIIVEKKLKNNSFETINKSYVKNGKTILKIDKEISSKDHRISIQYKSFLKGLKICPYYR